MCSVVQWGIAPPSYSTVRSGVLPELTEEDLRYDNRLADLVLAPVLYFEILCDRWAKKMKKKEALLLAFNQVAQFDRVMYDVLDALMDLSDLKKLPQVSVSKCSCTLLGHCVPTTRTMRICQS